MTAPVQAAVAGGSEKGVSTPAAAPAESDKTKKLDMAEKFAGNPDILKVLKQRDEAKRKAAPPAPPDKPAAPADAAKPEAGTPPPKKDETPKPGDEAKPKDPVDDSVVLDFAKLGKDEPKPEGEDAHNIVLTDEEAANADKAKAKFADLNKDNATQRRLKREATAQVTTLQAELAKVQKELDAARTQQPQVVNAGRYLSQFTKPEQVKAAHADALEVVRQLQEDSERESITLSGNRVWKMGKEDGTTIHAQVAALAFEILEDYEDRLKQLDSRSAAEKAVSEKLPHLTKIIPDFQKRYDTVLNSDWAAQGPSISMNAAIGELVTSGTYVLMKAGTKPAATPPASPAPQERKPDDLPSTTPPVRPVEAGKPDVSDLRAKAMSGDKEALKKWIKTGGK